MENLDFSESDSEFWIELDKKLVLNPLTHSKDSAHQDKPSLEEEVKNYSATAPNAYYRERFEKLVNQVRTAAECHFQNQLTRAKRDITKEYTTKIADLNLLHRDQVIELKKEFRVVEKMLQAKDRQISELQKYIIEQEFNIVNLRVDKKNKYDEEAKINELKATIESNKVVFDMQISYMKDVNGLYVKEYDLADSRLKSLECLFERTKQEFLEEKANFCNEIEAIKESNKAKIEKINEKYELFRNDANKEMNIRYVINKRQSDFIELLKTELKNAKFIIETPRMNAKYLRKLGYRNFSLGSSVEEPIQEEPKKMYLKPIYQKNPTLSTSLSTSTSPIYTNASELDLAPSYKYVGMIPESKYH